MRGSVCLEHAQHGSAEILSIALELLIGAKLWRKLVLNWLLALGLRLRLLCLAEVELGWVSEVAIGLEHELHCVEIVDVLTRCENWWVCRLTLALGLALSCENLVHGTVWALLG